MSLVLISTYKQMIIKAQTTQARAERLDYNFFFKFWTLTYIFINTVNKQTKPHQQSKTSSHSKC